MKGHDIENDRFEIYKSGDDQIEISVKLDNETVWLNRQQLAVLFSRDIKTIGKHIGNIFKEGELESESTVANFATVQKEGERTVERNIEYYNLDVIISVGYRVKSGRGTQFRQWATKRLKEYLVQGYDINQKRLEENKIQFHRTLEDLKLLTEGKAGIEIKNCLTSFNLFPTLGFCWTVMTRTIFHPKATLKKSRHLPLKCILIYSN